MSFTWETISDWFLHPTVLTIGIAVIVSLVVFAATLGTLERCFRAPGREWTAPRSRWLDLTYWFFTPLVTQMITTAALYFVFGRILQLYESGAELGPGEPSLMGSQPLWLQVLEVLLLGDFTHYWTHRLFHGRWLWPAHAIHHSPTELDWFSSMRMHPINDIVTHFIQALPLFLLGFSIESIALGVPIVTLVVICSHTNVPWTYGPLRYVIVSPVYHQWHHSSQPEALDKNFAGVFPVWDLIFGTWYLPRGQLATRFGCKSNQPPEHLPGQLAHPVRAWAVPAIERVMGDGSRNQASVFEEANRC